MRSILLWTLLVGRRAALLACVFSLVAAFSCRKEQAPPLPAPKVTAKAPARPHAGPEPFSKWCAPQSLLQLRWRTPHQNAALLADLFALPARAAQLYRSSQARVRDSERFLGQAIEQVELLSFRAPSLTRDLHLLRLSQAQYERLRQRFAQAAVRVDDHHEWQCAQLGPSYAQQLCLLDAPDIAWIDKHSTALDLQSLRQSRDLPDSPARRAFKEQWNQEPRPLLVMQSFVPSLHLELEQDPSYFRWELFEYGKKDRLGRPGWRGVMQLKVEQAATQIETLRAGEALADAPQAAALRQRAHIELLQEDALEIRLELHGDDPNAR